MTDATASGCYTISRNLNRLSLDLLDLLKRNSEGSDAAAEDRDNLVAFQLRKRTMAGCARG